MPRVKISSIPAELFEYYKNIFGDVVSSGFYYYEPGYGYIEMEYVRIGSNHPQPGNAGTDPAFIGFGRAYARDIYKKAAAVWHSQVTQNGVEPPLTGPRTKQWWILNYAHTFDNYYNYFVYSSKDFLKNMQKPSWGIKEEIYISDTGNNRIKIYDGNTGEYIQKVEGYGTPPNQFASPRGLCEYNNQLYVCDYGNSRIIKFDTSNFGYAGKIENRFQASTGFDKPSKIMVTETELYVLDIENQTIYILDKITELQIGEITGAMVSDEVPVAMYDIAKDWTKIYVSDEDNDCLKYGYGDNGTLTNRAGTHGNGREEFSEPGAITVDELNIYAVDRANKRIKKISKTGFATVETAGLYEQVYINMQQPDAICESGGYIFVTDNATDEVIKISKSTMLEVDRYGETGTGDNQLSNVTAMCGRNSKYYELG